MYGGAEVILSGKMVSVLSIRPKVHGSWAETWPRAKDF
jgi:hypothetical protein